MDSIFLKRYFFFLTLQVLWGLSCHASGFESKKTDLCNLKWEFSKTNSSARYLARVPGTIHTDLYRDGLIPDPFFACNEKELQWIGQTDWSYHTHFYLNENDFSFQNLELVFEGLDCFAEVILNGHNILEANNMFREWRVDIEPFVEIGGNFLEVRFFSALNRFLADSAALGYPLPGGRWNLSRKAAYHFGWDWGPTFITCGIWKPVYLVAYNGIKVEDASITTQSIVHDTALLKCEITVFSHFDKEISTKFELYFHGNLISNKDLNIEKGSHSFEFDFPVVHPQLWWCNGLGKPYLYEFELSLKTEKKEWFHKNIRVGIWNIQLVLQPDSIGTSFYFKLNGVPVFMKGANYIPSHSFLTETTNSDYERLLRNAKEANMNMLRVWGGGVYERDEFYSLADEMGILIWQDFMFACAMYPGDEEFFQNVRQEAIEQVRRLRNHPCLALWCGNNEIDEAWHNWGWRNQYQNSKLRDAVWSHYLNLFHRLLPAVVHQYDPGTSYIPSSPRFGWGRSQSMVSGDSHYWGVWWGQQPFEILLQKIPRFMSEFGFQSMPEISTIRKVQPPEADSLFSPQLRCHQKCSLGFEILSVYLEREGFSPQTLEEYIYTTQLVQAKGIGLGLAAQRASRPHCMGSLFWQLNDCWPVVSWSSMDFQGNRKALFYKTRQLFDPIAIETFIHEQEVKIFLFSDLPKDIKGTLTFEMRYYTGKLVPILQAEVNVSANSSSCVYSVPLNEFQQVGDYLFVATLRFDDSIIRKAYCLPGLLSQQNLPEAHLLTSIRRENDGYIISVKSDVFIAFIQFYLKESPAEFSDNFIHVWPGQNVEIFCRTSLPEQEFQRQFSFFTLNELYRINLNRHENK